MLLKRGARRGSRSCSFGRLGLIGRGSALIFGVGVTSRHQREFVFVRYQELVVRIVGSSVPIVVDGDVKQSVKLGR